MEHTCSKKTLSTTAHGKVIKCLSCKSYHIEFNNLLFTFSKDEFLHFRTYFLALDANYWEAKNTNSVYRRKIMIPVGHKNITALFNLAEIEELKLLFNPKKDTNHYASSIKLATISKTVCYN